MSIKSLKLKLLSRLYYIYFVLVFLVVFLLGYPYLRWLFHQKKLFEIHHLRRQLARIVLLLVGMPIKIDGQIVENGKPKIYCPNHSSYLDILVMLCLVEPYHLFLGKIELQKLPLFGIFFREMDIPVPRGDAYKSTSVIKESMSALKSGTCLIIFPEGGILPQSPILQEYKDGPFALSKKLGIPIVPVTLLNCFKRLPDGKKLAYPGKIKVILNPELNPLDFMDVEHLKKKCFDITNHQLEAENNL